MAIKTAKDRNIGVIGFSGGVGYNDAIVRRVGVWQEKKDLSLLFTAKYPAGMGE